MRFTKMQGIGNDYIYVNAFEEKVPDPSKLAIRISDRHFGAGSDGLVLIAPSDKADFRMRMFNRDGSEGKMCGNAARCIGRYVVERGLTRNTVITLETPGGIRKVETHVKDGHVVSVSVDMGEPAFRHTDIPTTLLTPQCAQLQIDTAAYEVVCLSMGNPHCVVFVEEPEALDLPFIGSKFEHHAVFPEGVNTEFVCVQDDGSLRMRVWERGSGETMACGTGACAALVASVIQHLGPRENTVHLRGGDLHLRWSMDGSVIQEGPAAFVYDGIWPDEN